MEIIYLIVILLLAFFIWFRLNLDNAKAHKLYCQVNKLGSIEVYDNYQLIAVIYRDRTIEWRRSTSFFKMVKIKEISDRFEEELDKLNQEL